MLTYTCPLGRHLSLPALRSLPASVRTTLQSAGRTESQLCCSQQADTPDECKESTAVLSTLRKGFAPQKRSQLKAKQAAKMNGTDEASVKQQLAAAVYSEAWKEVDKKVNSYPSMRIFTAVGLDSMDVPSSSTSSADEASSSPSSSADFLQLTLAFHQSIRVAVEGVVGPVPDDAVSTRPSSQGKYVSVKVGPVRVETAEQVVEIFSNIRNDPRMKFYL